MDLNLIKKLVRILDTSGITDLEVEESGFKIKIAKKVRTVSFNGQQQMIHSASQDPDLSNVDLNVEEKSKESEEATKNQHIIISPIVGTFYRAPTPDADSYVQVGDMVSQGTVLCIVEAMKLMNEIESDVSGKIIKTLAENGKPVEYNQPLFLIQTN
jgi:acetyl-CoA carboxylase biotin carboxyl carrier protein